MDKYLRHDTGADPALGEVIREESGETTTGRCEDCYFASHCGLINRNSAADREQTFTNLVDQQAAGEISFDDMITGMEAKNLAALVFTAGTFRCEGPLLTEITTTHHAPEAASGETPDSQTITSTRTVTACQNPAAGAVLAAGADFRRR
jgi:hypothetical protein